MSQPPVVGLHSAVYLDRADLERAVRDADRVALLVLSGIERPTPLELLGLTVLKANGLIGSAG